MAIHSMTAFARTQHQRSHGNFICEIRTINHRYLEIGMHLPDMLRVLEMPMREAIQRFLKRGKVECSVRYQANPAAAFSAFTVNLEVVKQLSRGADAINDLLKEPGVINTVDLLRMPGVMQTNETDVNELRQDMMEIVDETLKELIVVRAREGEDLKHLFLQRLDALRVELNKVRTHLPQVMIDQRERLNKRFNDAKVELDPIRLEQEMLMFAQKIDVAEEIERAETHINEVTRILHEGGVVGRRLDFLLQELNREANTLGSKSVDAILMHAAVEMKVLIEQIREQVQNVE